MKSDSVLVTVSCDIILRTVILLTAINYTTTVIMDKG